MTFGHYGPRSTEVGQRNSGRTRNSRPTEIFKSARAPKTGVFGQALDTTDQKKTSLRLKRKAAAWDDDFRVKIMGLIRL
jgi:hypothetical protein